MVQLEVSDCLLLIELYLPKQLLKTICFTSSENIGLVNDPRVHFFWIFNYSLDVKNNVSHSLLAQQLLENF